MIKAEETIVQVGFVIAVLLFVIATYLFGSVNGEHSLIQKLCQKNQYDFCEVAETTYRLKEFKE